MFKMFPSLSQAFGTAKKSDQDFLEDCWLKFVDLMEYEESGCTPKYLRAFRSKIPQPIEIKAELTEKTLNFLQGEFIVRNNISEFEDRIDFKVIADTSHNQMLCRAAYDRTAVVLMPHWYFPYDITNYPARMMLYNFLKQEAQERVGVDASLMLEGPNRIEWPRP